MNARKWARHITAIALFVLPRRFSRPILVSTEQDIQSTLPKSNSLGLKKKLRQISTYEGKKTIEKGNVH